MKYKMLLGKILFYIFIIYVGVSTVVYFYQRKLLYHPGENNYLDEGPLNHKIEKVYIQSDNKLVAWRYLKDKSFKTILFFHGNAGKLDNRIYKLNEFSALLGLIELKRLKSRIKKRNLISNFYYQFLKNSKYKILKSNKPFLHTL